MPLAHINLSSHLSSLVQTVLYKMVGLNWPIGQYYHSWWHNGVVWLFSTVKYKPSSYNWVISVVLKYQPSSSNWGINVDIKYQPSSYNRVIRVVLKCQLSSYNWVISVALKYQSSSYNWGISVDIKYQPSSYNRVISFAIKIAISWYKLLECNVWALKYKLHTREWLVNNYQGVDNLY